MTNREAIECMEYLNEHQYSALFKALVSSEQREIISEGIRLSISALKEREDRGKRYNRHEVAEILAEAFKDTCACNFNGNDEWLPMRCDFGETVCPDVVGVTCWEQYLKHLDERPKPAMPKEEV